MLDALVAGQIDPEQLADLALGHLRAKIPQLRLALEGKIREHHRFLLKRLLHQLRFIESEIDLLDQRLEGLGQQDPTLAASSGSWDHGAGCGSCGSWELSSRDRHCHGAIPHSSTLGELGRALSREWRECR